MHLDMLQRTEGIEKTPGLVEVSEELHQLEEHHHKASRRTLYDRQSIDIRVFTVPAKPWTTITDDNDFVTHLISLWFTWYQPCFNWVDRDLFIREMQSQDLDSEYCSPFLVNAILADACVSTETEQLGLL